MLMKKSTMMKLLRYGQFVMLAVITLFVYLDFVVLEATIGFALLGKYLQLAIGFTVMQYIYWKVRNAT